MKKHPKKRPGFLKHAFTAAETALLVIDVQRAFFSPRCAGSDYADRVARKINSYATAMRKKGVDIYAVYMPPHNAPHKLAATDFYRFHPEPGDFLVPKTSDALFATGNVYKDRIDIGKPAAVLKARGVKNVIVCGGYLSYCVKAAVMGALRQKFNHVCLVENLSTDGMDTPEDLAQEQKTRDKLHRRGAVTAGARTLYKNII